MSKSTSPARHEPHASSVAYEQKDVNVFWITIVGLIIAVTIGICYVVCWLVFDSLKSPPVRASSTLFVVDPQAEDGIPAPRLEGINRMARFLATGQLSPVQPSPAQQRLEAYGWVDREARIVHIPIQRAMQAVVEHKLLPAASAAEAEPEARPSSANSGRPQEGRTP